MRQKDLIEYIHQHPETYLQKARISGYICPKCHSGSGPNGTGITSSDGGIHFTCHARKCFVHSDVIDIIGIERGLSDYPSKIREAARIYGKDIDDLEDRQRRGSPHTQKSSSKNIHNNLTQSNSTIESHNNLTQSDKAMENQTPSEENQSQATPPSHTDGAPINPQPMRPLIDHTKEFEEWHSHINETTYHRGLSQATLDRFQIGFCEKWVNPEPRDPTKPQHPAPMIIIPTSKFSAIARDTRPGKKHFSQVGSPRRIFNSNALYESRRPIFVVESEIDALSIIDVGGDAIGLGGVGMAQTLIKMIRARRPSQPLIISLDNDIHGEDAKKEIKKNCDILGIFYQELNVSGECKDANEALMKDRETFAKEVEEAIEIARCAQADAQDSITDELKRDSVSYAMDGFLERIQSQDRNRVYSTGFKNLDEALGGGLFAGLYVFGAISSLGKTTFCLQLADQLAARGHDVLFFSLEMARDELMAKSISRFTFLFSKNRRNAKTARSILHWSRLKNLTNEDMMIREKAILEHRSLGNHLFITERIGELRVEDIEKKVKRHYQATGVAPIVIIDYLQIITPYDTRATDKQNTDRAVSELKRMSRDYNIPVIGISSFNRENYTNPVGMISFKESGAIEYSSDVLIGGQYKGMDYSDEDKSKEAREKRVRKVRRDAENQAREGDHVEIQLKILKNRNGSRGGVMLFYHPMFNCFSEEENPHVESDGYDEALL